MEIRRDFEVSERYWVGPLVLEVFSYFLGFLREVFHDTFQKGAHDVLLVPALIQLRNIDPVVATLARANSEAQDPLINHPVKVYDDGGPGDRLTLAQLLVHVYPGLARSCAFVAHGPDVPEGDLLVLLEGFP